MQTASIVPSALPPEDRAALEAAWHRLASPSFAARAAALLGQPLEAGMRRLPPQVRTRLDAATDRALERALDVATGTLRPIPTSIGRQRALTIGLGAAGGLLGPAGLVLELPATTVLMLRTIADVARREDEDLDDPETRLACLQVFALGSPSPADDAAETGFFELRIALATQFSTATLPMGLSTGGHRSAQLIQAIARRFGVVVGQKAAARAVPLVGAVTGASLNAVFFEHYLDIARGHFVVRRLERRWGRLLVEEELARLRDAAHAA